MIIGLGLKCVKHGVTSKNFPEKDIVWDYVNSYPMPSLNDVFKIDYIPPEEPPQPDTPNLDYSGSFRWINVKPGETVNGTFQVQNIGDEGSLLNWTVNTSSITWGTWSFTPASGENLTPEDGQVTIEVSVIAPNETNSGFQCYVRVENIDNSSDFGLIPVHLKTPKNIHVFHRSIYQFIVKFKNLYFKRIYNLYKTLAWFY